MNIKDKAKEYAEGKAINALTAAIESAYAEGYNAGFNDGVASKEGEKPDDLDDGVEYVDLGLPSGTKWAADYLKDKDGNIVYMPYEKAIEMNIPTAQQLAELVNNCHIKSTYEYISSYTINGINGEFVCYNNSILYEAERGSYAQHPVFCVKLDGQEGIERLAAYIGMGDGLGKYIFMGTKVPVILVR